MFGLLEEDRYIEERVFQYLFISDKEDHRRFISDHRQSDEDETISETFLTAIKNAITSDNSLLSEFFFNSRVKRYIAKSRLKRHVYIPAGSGSGKSEIIKYMFHELIKDKKLNVNLLEPHQDLALEVLQFSSIRKQRERLVLLDPNIRHTARFLTGEDIIKEDVKFVINPFDLKYLDEVLIESLIEELLALFFSLLDSEATQNMELVIEACLETLLRAGYARGEPYSIVDLKRFMSHEENADLVREGMKLQNIERRKVIQKLSDDKAYKSQRAGIYNRLGKILGKDNFRRLVIGRSTVDIGKAMNSGKIMICNFPKSPFGAESSSILGKFYISMLQAHATRRATIPKNKRPNSFVFIDECQRFIIPTIEEILEESRKYRLYMILANQFVGQKMTTAMKDTLLANTGLKIAGVMNKKSVDAVCGEMFNVTSKDFHKLEPYQFFLYDNKYREMGSQKIKVPDYLVKKGRPFYSKKKHLKELFKYVANDSGYYVPINQEGENNLSGSSTPAPPRKERGNQRDKTKVYNPNFDD